MITFLFRLRFYHLLQWPLIGLPLCVLLAGGCSDEALSPLYNCDDPLALAASTAPLPAYREPDSHSEVIGYLQHGEVICRPPAHYQTTAKFSTHYDPYCGLWVAVRLDSTQAAWIRWDTAVIKPYDNSTLRALFSQLILEATFGSRWLSPYISLEKLRAYSDLFEAYQRLDSLMDAANAGRLNVPNCLIPHTHAWAAGQPGIWISPAGDWASPDFRLWRVYAGSTPSSHDDAFFQLIVKYYPGPEGKAGTPAWRFPTETGESYSLLGRGIHLSLLQKTDSLWQAAPNWRPELNQLKQALVDDITSGQTRYWEDQSAILVEMDRLIRQKWVILSPADRVAIKEQARRFAEPETHRIQLNYRAGWHEL